MLANGIDFEQSVYDYVPNKPRLDVIETEAEFIARFVHTPHNDYETPWLHRYVDGRSVEWVSGGEFQLESIVSRVADWENRITPEVTSYGVGNREFVFYVGADGGGYDVVSKVYIKMIGGDGAI